MAIKINGQDLLKRFINGQEIVRVYKQGIQIRPETVPPVFDDYLCFTAEQSNSTVALNKIYNPTDIYLEISYDKTTWMGYSIGGVVALSNVGDKVYFRNKSETPTTFSTSTSDRYRYSMTGTIRASGNIMSLLCKTPVTASITSIFCFYELFSGCTSLTTAPKLPATSIANRCYENMFSGCSSLTTAPELPATTVGYASYSNMFRGCTALTTIPMLPSTNIADDCYLSMFYGCSSIKLSMTQEGEYQTPYRIPSLGTGVIGSTSLNYMFSDTGGTFTGTPSINTTYYTSNQVI